MQVLKKMSRTAKAGFSMAMCLLFIVLGLTLSQQTASAASCTRIAYNVPLQAMSTDPNSGWAMRHSGRYDSGYPVRCGSIRVKVVGGSNGARSVPLYVREYLGVNGSTTEVKATGRYVTTNVNYYTTLQANYGYLIFHIETRERNRGVRVNIMY